jgi:hypothetical protein
LKAALKSSEKRSIVSQLFLGAVFCHRVAASLRASASPILPVMALLVMRTGLSYLMLSSKPKLPETRLTIQSIAVLPFKPLASQSSDADLGLEMADALITQLSNVRQITVRPTSSVLKYDRSTQDLLAAGATVSIHFKTRDSSLRLKFSLCASSVKGSCLSQRRKTGMRAQSPCSGYLLSFETTS